MYIVQGIRKNVDGKPDYIWTKTDTNGRVCVYETERLAEIAISNASDPAYQIYGLKMLFIPKN